MDDSYPGKLEVWPAWALAVIGEVPMPAHGRAPLGGPHNPGAFADRLYESETLNAVPPAARPPGAAEPYSLQWFLDIESQRHGRQGRWIPRLLEFAKHSGETLLGLGSGLGTDWIQYARHGAHVVVCTPGSEQLALVRRNFELRGLPGRFLSAQPTSLPLESCSIDVVCVSGLLDEVADPHAVVGEVYRVLKPGGKVLAVTPARYDVDYWTDLLMPWLRWLRPRRAAASPMRFSARRLHRLFGQFVEHRVYKRQLRRREVPHLWRWLPLPLLERVMGRVLVLMAFKPLSAALPAQLAALK
jgi:ubiquinone/menaquinone biosynthesis C-methylase UbiE